jgi:hypothetical protein
MLCQQPSVLRWDLLWRLYKCKLQLLRLCALQQALPAVLRKPLLPKDANLLWPAVLPFWPRLLPRPMLPCSFGLLRRYMLPARLSLLQ